MGLLWTDMMPTEDIGTGNAGLGTTLMVIGAIAGWLVGMLVSVGLDFSLGIPGMAQADESGQVSVIWSVAPFMLALLAAMFTCRARPQLYAPGGITTADQSLKA
jgi:hypothetical protein